MPLLLTILSVVALWAFLTVLTIGLLLIIKPLQRVRGQLQRIAMGVAAIEQQTRPLEAHAMRLVDGLGRASDAAADAGARFQEADRDLGAAVSGHLSRP